MSDRPLSLDLRFCKDDTSYSDGSIEDTMLDMAKRELTFEECMAEDSSWPVLYHFSPVRENLLSWYDFGPDAHVLEIGAGCGAVTGAIARKSKHVTALELTRKRASILAERHKRLSNVDVIVGNLSDIEFEKQFDVITLIGVLEYACTTIDSDRPFHTFLDQVKKLLKPNGMLLVAIENRLGLKYWNGIPEDHSAKLFDGLNGYPDGGPAKTFSKFELTELLSQAGFNDQTFYYPHPDYKLPLQIFSQDHLPSPGGIESRYPIQLPAIVSLFDLSTVENGLIENGIYEQFANSFLVSCKAGKQPVKTTFAKFANYRKPEFQVATILKENSEDSIAVKSPIREEAKEHIADLAKHYSSLSKSAKRIKPIEVKLENDDAIFPFVEGTSLDSLLVERLHVADWDGFKRVISDFSARLEEGGAINNDWANSEAFQEVFGQVEGFPQICLSPANIDTVFTNLFVIDNPNEDWAAIDYEWTFNFAVPVRFILYRALDRFCFAHSSRVAALGGRSAILATFDFTDEECETWKSMERSFQYYVYGGEYPFGLPESYFHAAKYPSVQELVATFEAKSRQLEEAEHQLREAHTREEALLNSSSWKITAPIRALIDLLKGKR